VIASVYVPNGRKTIPQNSTSLTAAGSERHDRARGRALTLVLVPET